MSAEEIANYLKINVKNVYQFAKNGEIPATRIGNKWLFPRRIIDEWIDSSARRNVRATTLDYSDMLLSIGSNDPFWEILSNELIQRPYNTIVPYASVGSCDGLRALERGKALLAGIHLYDPDTDSYNTPFLSRYLPGSRVSLIHLFNRRQGLILKSGNPKGIRSIRDLARSDVVLVNRRAGSGTRLLLDSCLSKEGIPPESLQGYDREVDTHYGLAMAVRDGGADAGIGIEIAARACGLDFIPMKEESYDIVVRSEYMVLPSVRAMLDFMQSRRFKDIMRYLPGYDLHGSCSPIWEGTVRQ
ncbi:MAG: helix-turn-helix transcriptional regulator [Spirochaetes bacterium]|nr:helix-turn-helix transcriptional regulator [Spirochaetota bacterium]